MLQTPEAQELIAQNAGGRRQTTEAETQQPDHHDDCESGHRRITTLEPMMASSDAMEAAAYAAKYRKYERDYLRRINHLYFSGKTPDNGTCTPPYLSISLSLSLSHLHSMRCLLPPPLSSLRVLLSLSAISSMVRSMSLSVEHFLV
jgi:hypothetical protein